MHLRRIRYVQACVLGLSAGARVTVAFWASAPLVATRSLRGHVRALASKGYPLAASASPSEEDGGQIDVPRWSNVVNTVLVEDRKAMSDNATEATGDNATYSKDNGSSPRNIASEKDETTEGNDSRKDISNIVKEAEGGTPAQKTGNRTVTNDHDSNGHHSNDKIELKSNDQICRVVATSDAKIPPRAAISSLSPPSKALFESVELLYSVQSRKELRDLAYTQPGAATDIEAVYPDELSLVETVPEGNGMDGATPGNAEQEVRLVSILRQALEDAGFQRMERRDLDLCAALNTEYLLRLSLRPDVQALDPAIGREFYPELYERSNQGNEARAIENTHDPNKSDAIGPATALDGHGLLFDGRALVFHRGYSREVTTGRLLLPKLDYLQASLVQRSTTAVTRKVEALEQRLRDAASETAAESRRAVVRASSHVSQRFDDFVIRFLKNYGLDISISSKKKPQPFSDDELLGDESQPTVDGERRPPRLDERAASPSEQGSRILNFGRYRTRAPTFLSDSFDLSEALTPFLVQGEARDGVIDGNIKCQYDQTASSRRTAMNNGASDKIPSARRLLERVSIQNTVNFFSTKGRRDLIANFFRSSTLVEPAYEEVVVIWRPLRKKKSKTLSQRFPPKWLYKVAEVFDVEDRLPALPNRTREEVLNAGLPPLEIRAFDDVPMANVVSVLPKTKLVFRPADAIVFDLVSIISFLAVAASLRYDSLKLDLLALTSLAFFAVRTFFRYSNKYARYDLLVNKFLTSKISHRGPGALKYLLAEANTNRALRAVLVRDWLRGEYLTKNTVDRQGNGTLFEQGRAYVNKKSSLNDSQINVDITAALEDLKKLELIEGYDVKEEQKARDSMRQLWNDTF